MTRRERVLEAIAHRQPDSCPYQLDFTKEALAKLEDFTGGAVGPGSLGNHMAIIEWGGFSEIAPDVYEDHFGVRWNRSIDKDIGVVENTLLPEPTLRGFQFPDPNACPIGQNLSQFVEQNVDRLRVVGIGFSGFERAWTLRGMQNLLMDMLLHPAFVEELMEAITEYNLRLIDRALEYDIDCIRFGDDWGQQKGLIFGLDLWRRFIKPSFSRMFARAKDAGKVVMLHSCGRVQELFPDLIDMGLDIFNTFQPEIMDPGGMKREFGRDLTFYGGISTQQVLPFVTPKEVKETVWRMIDLVGKDGGYIVAPTHGMPKDIPAENMAAFVEAVQNQRSIYSV